MRADECLSGLVHAIQIEGAVPFQDRLPGERIWAIGVIAHPIRVAPPDRTETCIESRGGRLEVPDADIRGKCTVHASTVDLRVLDGDVEVDHLATGMHAGIGASGARCLHLGAVEVRENLLELPLDGAQGSLLGPAGEIRAVVRDRGAQTTQPATIGGGL